MSTLTKKSALAIGAIPACGCRPAAWSFATIFLELWASQRPDDPGLDAYREEQPFPAEEPTIGLVQPYSDSPVDDENVSKNVYLDLITQRRKRCGSPRRT